MPFVGPQSEKVFAGFGGGLVTVAGGITIPQDAVSDIKNLDIESAMCLRFRNGCGYYTTQSSGGRIGYLTGTTNATCAGSTTTVTVTGTDLTAYIDNSGSWLFVANGIAGNGIRIASASFAAGNTTLTLVSNGGAGTNVSWTIYYVDNPDMLWRHYGASSSDKATLVAYGKRIDTMTATAVTKLTSSQTTGLQTHPITINGVTYLCNGTDLPLRYDTSSGLVNASSFLAAPASTPIFLFSSYVDTGYPLNAGWAGFNSNTNTTLPPKYYDDTRTQKGTGAGAYGARYGAGAGAVAWQTVARRGSHQTTPLLDIRSAAYNECPFFMVPDAVPSTKRFQTGTYSAAGGTATVTFSSFSPSGSSIAVGDVFLDASGDFYRVTSGIAAGQFVVDRNVTAATASSNWFVFKNRAAAASTAMKISPSPGRLSDAGESFKKTNYSVGGVATLTGGSFETDETAASVVVNPGDLIIVWPTTTYAAGTANVADLSGSGTPRQWSFTRAGTTDKFVSVQGFDDAYKETEDSGLWQFQIGGVWYDVNRQAAGPSITDEAFYLYEASGTFSTGSNPYTINARPKAASWPSYRVAVVASKVSSTVVNLLSHTGAIPASSNFAIIKGPGAAASSSGIELFKSDNNSDYYEANTLYGNNGLNLGVSGCVVVDTASEGKGNAYNAGISNTGIPIYKFAIWHLGCLFAFNIKERDGSASYPTQYRYSNPETPEVFDPQNQNFVTHDSSEGECVGAFKIQQNLFCLLSNALYALPGDLPENIEPTPIDTRTSCATWKSIAVGGGRAFWLGYDGVYMFDGVAPQLISLNIDNVVRPLSATLKQQASGVWRNKRYWLTLPGSGEAPTTDNGTSASRTYIYDPYLNNWTKYFPPVVASSWFQCDNSHDSGELLFLKRDNRSNNTATPFGQYIYQADMADTTLDLTSLGITAYADTVRTQFDDPTGKQIPKWLDLVLTGPTTGTVALAYYYDSGDGTFTQVLAST